MPIRRLNTSDAEAYRELRLRSLREVPEAFTASYEDVKTRALDTFRDTLESMYVFAEERDGTLLAMTGLTMYDGRNIRHKGYVWGVYVDDSLRGQGIGRALMEAVFACAKEHGLELLQLGVSTINPSALKLYESLGYEQYGIEKHAMKLGDQAIDEILMVKWLAAAD